MKIVSVLIFGVALIASWRAVYAPRAIPESMHVSIQQNMKKLIQDYVLKNQPGSKNFRFDRFWTETLSPTKVKAEFAYSFDDGSQTEPARVAIDGTAILDKVGDTPDATTWSFDQLKISNNKVNFQQPVHISPGSK